MALLCIRDVMIDISAFSLYLLNDIFYWHMKKLGAWWLNACSMHYSLLQIFCVFFFILDVYQKFYYGCQ
jgi:hypothetical protein